ncbi:MAG: hypothetical protein HY943_21105 [Gammaproteobacteria bacterium]|nr:hypothetical protein [Gammaproteobacteria bacterium]
MHMQSLLERFEQSPAAQAVAAEIRRERYDERAAAIAAYHEATAAALDREATLAAEAERAQQALREVSGLYLARLTALRRANARRQAAIADRHAAERSLATVLGRTAGVRLEQLARDALLAEEAVRQSFTTTIAHEPLLDGTVRQVSRSNADRVNDAVARIRELAAAIDRLRDSAVEPAAEDREIERIRAELRALAPAAIASAA